MIDRSLDGLEWVCLQCGHRDYGLDFEPFDRPDDRQRNRAPRHGGATL